MKTSIKIVITLIVICVIGVQQGKLVGWEPSAQHKVEKNTSMLGTISLEQSQTIFPEAYSLSTIDTSWVEVHDKAGKKLGELILSSPYSDKIIGFAGTTPLLIALGPEGKIKKVELLDNAESPDYVAHVREKKLFEAWTGLTIDEALNKKVDAVSGATYTSTAVIQSLKARLSVIDKAKEMTEISWSNVAKQIVLLLILGLALYSFFRPLKSKKLRLPLLILSVGVLGFWQSSMLSLAQFLSWLTNGVPLSMQIGLFIIFLFSVLLPLFTGKAFYCVYLCPFGAAQELVGKVNKRKYILHAKLVKYLHLLRKAILIAIVFILIIGVNFDLSYIEPFSAFNLSAASLSAIVIALVSLLLSIFIHKPWCHYLCPAGQTLDWMKLKKNKKIKR